MRRLFLLLVALIYLLLGLFINHSLFRQTDYSYYNFLLDAFTSGRLNVLHPHSYDLSIYNEKFFLYWGPLAVIFIFPFFLVSNLGASDVFYTLIAGILNVVLFYFIVDEAVKFFKLKLTFWPKIFVVASFAFCSPNFYLSLGGRIWHTSQIIAVFYSLIFLYFYFKFLNNKSRIIFFALSVLFFNFAWLTRLSLIYYVLLFIHPFMQYPRKVFNIFTIITIISVTFFLSYNYLRFGDPLETGVRYQLASSKFIQASKEGKIFSFSNIPHNAQYQVFNPPSFSLRYPYIKFDPEGNGIFFVYPLLVGLIYFTGSNFTKKNVKVFFLLVFLVAVISASTILLYLGTGWYQFGARYFFDLIPLLFLLTIFIVNNIPLPLRFILFFYGAIINFVGALSFPWFS